jgi:hypothetical protein
VAVWPSVQFCGVVWSGGLNASHVVGSHRSSLASCPWPQLAGRLELRNAWGRTAIQYSSHPLTIWLTCGFPSIKHTQDSPSGRAAWRRDCVTTCRNRWLPFGAVISLLGQPAPRTIARLFAQPTERQSVCSHAHERPPQPRTLADPLPSARSVRGLAWKGTVQYLLAMIDLRWADRQRDKVHARVLQVMPIEL